VLRAIPLLLLPVLMGAAESMIDHVTVAGSDLKRLRAALLAAGIPSEYGGPHRNAASEMALTSFPDGSYLELIAPRPDAGTQALERHNWGQFMKGNAGPCAWAARVKDMHAEVKPLRAAGIAVSDPEQGGRERPDGVRLEWETAQVGSEPNGAFFPFLIRDITARKLRVFPGGKPTTTDFNGVNRVVIAVRDLAAAIERYRAAYALPAPIKQVDASWGAQLALMGSVPVVLAAPLHPRSWLAERIAQFGEGPCAFVLSARRPGRYQAASHTRWFGVDIAWFDPATLGWRLGFQ
jgi:hypothetical protein